MKRRAVFLDRDGVLLKFQENKGGLRPARTLEEMEYADDASECLQRLRDAGFATIVVTNQPDIARGKIGEKVVTEMNDRLLTELRIDAVYVCPHDNDERCDCRKPKPGLILQAAVDHDLDLGRSCLIGDRWVDVVAAEAAGIDGILLEGPHSWESTSSGKPPPIGFTRYRALTLTECVDFVLTSGRYQ